MITRTSVERRILAYLNRNLTLTQLVDWAELMMMEGEFAAQDSDLLTEIIAKLGLADIREFGLSWEDCYQFLARLGYQVRVTAVAV